jgi:hypothetical protein
MRLLGGGLLGGRVRFSEGFDELRRVSSSSLEEYVLRFPVNIYWLN